MGVYSYMLKLSTDDRLLGSLWRTTMPKPNLATADQTAAPNLNSPTGGQQRPPSDSRGTVEAANADTAPAIIVFGLDPSGKPKAATFPAHQVDLAIKAAGLMQLRTLKIDSPELAQFATQLPVGKIYASGHGFVPLVRSADYDQLLQFADPAPAPGLPATWDDIDVGDLVIARDEAAGGWWEAIVIAKDGDMLTLQFRDYPKQAPVVLHRAALALLKPIAA
jgi:hypothetical protein